MKTLNTSDCTASGPVLAMLRQYGLDPHPGARYAVYLAGWRESPELFYQAEDELESELLSVACAHGLLVELEGRLGQRPQRRAG